MNTLQSSKPLDLYEEQRRDVEIDGDGDLNTILDQLRADVSGGAPAQTDPAISPADVVQAQAPPPGADNPPSPEFGVEQEKEGFMAKTLEFVEWASSPLVAFADAGLAPIAHDYESESTVGKVGEAFKVSGEAFISRLLPKYGEEHELYGSTIVEKVMPNAPDSVKAFAATSLEIVADPSIALGLGSAKVIQKGLKAGATTKGPFKGIWQEGIHEVLTVGKGKDVTDIDLGEIGRLAELADAGDARAVAKLTEVLDGNEVILDSVAKADDADVRGRMKNIRTALGNEKGDLFDAKLKDTPDPDALIKRSLDGNTTTHAININLARLNSETDVDTLIKNMADFYEGQFTKAAGKQANSETEALAQAANLSDLLGRPATQFAPHEAYALRQMLVSSGEQLYALANKADASKDPLDLLAFRKGVVVHQAIQAKATGVAAEAGRLLQQYNMIGKSNRQTIRQVGEAIVAAGDDPTYNTLLRKMVKSTDDPVAISKILGKSAYRKGADALYEVYVNAILSGPATHGVNIVSNMLMVGMRPTEKFLQGMSAAARADFQQARTNGAEAIAMLHGITQGIGDGFRLIVGKESVQSLGLPEDVVRMHELSLTQSKKAISSEALGAQGKLGVAVDAIGSLIRLPGAALLKEDVVFKNIHNRIEVNSAAARKAMSAGVDANTTRSIYNAMRSNPDEHVRKTAKDMMEYYTFTNKLGETGTAFHNWVKKVPSGQVFIPFFRTPMNIVKMGVRHSILGNVFKDLGNIAAKGAKGDIARAKVAMGTLAPVVIMSMIDDNITGAVDESTPSGRFKAENGHPPYSIRVGDTWISYERLEPIRTILGLYVNAKDALDNIQRVDPETGEDTELYKEVFTATIAPLIKTLGDNYMMPTVGTIINMLNGVASGNPDYAWKQFNRMATSAIPYSNFMRQTNQAIFDPVYRDSETIIEQAKALIPGLSQGLPARKTIWGDDKFVVDGHNMLAMSPIRTAGAEMDELDLELVNLEVSIPGQVENFVFNGVPLDLNIWQQERLSVIRGKGVEGGPTLKEVMRTVYEDPAFQALPPEIRKERYEWIFGNATEQAKQYLMSEDPTLQMQYNNRLQARQLSLQGS